MGPNFIHAITPINRQPYSWFRNTFLRTAISEVNTGTIDPQNKEGLNQRSADWSLSKNNSAASYSPT